MAWFPATMAVLFLFGQTVCDLYLPTITASLVNKGILQQNFAYIMKIGWRMLIVAGLGLMAATVNVFLASRQSMKIGAQLRSKLYAKVLNFAGQEMTQFGTSTLITRTTNDVVQVQTVMFQVLRQMLRSPMILVSACVLAYIKAPRLTVIYLITLPILTILCLLVLHYATPLFHSIQGKTDRINQIFREGLTGVRVIRAFNQEDHEQNRFDYVNRDYTQTGVKAYSLVACLYPAMTLVLSLTDVGIIMYGGQMIAVKTLNVGDLIAFITYTTQILTSFMRLSRMFVSLPRASASAKRINDILETPSSVKYELTPPTKSAVTETTKRPNMQLQKVPAVEFRHVSFRYPGAERLALDDISFTADRDSTIAVIGGTGAGKSTLIDLLAHLYEPAAGQILVEGRPVNSIPANQLHRYLTVAQQKTVLFSGTVRSNLQKAKPDASDDEMWHALDVAQASKFVQAAGGLDARVQQGGHNFSGGQRQRLAIARTLVADADIYVFDDTFSALDFQTDANLRLALAADPQMKGKLVVIVAQRVATVLNADQILVLDNGKLVGRGTHEELAKSNRTYQQIMASQLKQGGGSHA